MEAKKANGGCFVVSTHTVPSGVIPAGYPPSNIEMEDCDPVHRPAHYTQGQIECADFIDDQQLPHHEASAVEYIVRARFKGKEVQDLQKAVWHLNRRIQLLAKKSGIS